MTYTVNDVQKLYVAFFNRPADKLGEAFWLDKLNTGAATPASIAAAFAGSAEYKSLYAGMDAAQTVAQLYTNLFGRAAVADEVTFWGLRLLQGKETVDTIAMSLATYAQGTDMDAIVAKTSAAVAFTAALDTVPEITGYSGLAANANARTWLAGVKDATTLASATGATALNTAISGAVDAANGAAGQTFTLTNGVDHVVGTAGNDIINAPLAVNPATGAATIATAGSFDSIDGGAGVDTLNIYVTGATAAAPSITVTNVENINFTDDNSLTADVSAWGGSTVSVVQAAGNAAAQAITAAAPTVSVKGGSTVGITDGSAKANVVTTANVDSNGGKATITGTAIANVSLANSAQAADIVNAGATGKATLNLTVNNVTGGAIITDTKDEYSTVNITATGKKSSIELDGKTGAAFAGKTLSVGGDAALTLKVNAASALTTVTVSGSGGLTSDLSAGTVTSIDASASTGANVITVDGTKATYKGGSGNDTVTLAAAPTKAIDGGAGTDTVAFSGVTDLSTLNKTALANVTNFEVLQLTGVVGTAATPAKNTLDVSALPTGFNGVVVNTTTDKGDLIINKVATGFNFTELASQTFKSTIALKTDGLSDVLNLNLGNAKSAAIDAKTGGGVVATGFETVNITSSADTSAAAVQHKLNLTDATATSLAISGAAGVDFTGSTLSAVATVSAASATGDIKIDLTGGLTTGVTVTTGTGNDTIKSAAAAGKVDTINSGTGNDNITVGDGDNVINAGGGTAAVGVTIVAGNGENSITVGGSGKSSITVGSGNNVVVGGAGADTVHVGSGANTLTLGAGKDVVVFDAVSSSSAIFTTVKDAAAGDSFDFGTVAAIANGTAKLGAALTSGVNDYQTFLNAAAGKGAGVVSWFQFGGDTYVVEDVSATNSFAAGTDHIVKLTGLIDLSGATIAGNVITLV
ncbi:DUF4214 domain-containing protein [Oxalobacteraceae bacterium OM1]|nr:DUF4214 domain-containing protein [Oxalobacteraceae bacterium OM1]